MTCNGSIAEQLAEDYVLGRLPADQTENFEEHYFSCPVCLEHLQALQMTQEVLPQLPVDAPERQRIFSWPSRLLVLSAVAATVVFGFISLRTSTLQRPAPGSTAQVQPAPAQPAAAEPGASTAAPVELAQLADPNLPPYQAPQLRGASDAGEFSVGMTAYSAGKYGDALRHLSAVPAGDAQAGMAAFYAGTSAYRLHQWDRAAAQLQTAAQDAAAPQYEAALYYLAQTMLARSDASQARRYLLKTASLRGDYEKRARAELARMDAAGNRK